MEKNEQEIEAGDLVEVTAVARVESVYDKGYLVRLHGELVPMLKSQCKLIPDPPKEGPHD